MLPILLFFIGPAISAQNLAEVTVLPEGIRVAAARPGVSFMLLRIAGPDGQIVCDQSSYGSPLHWSPIDTALNGRYSYEVRVSAEKVKTKRDEAQKQNIKIRPWVKSGSLFIRNGAIVIPTEEEAGLLRWIYNAGKAAWAGIAEFIIPSAFAEHLIAEDLIVRGSECLGMDCASGEIFGYDTLKFKENNLQIYFEDTSNSSLFPTNDWKIQINDQMGGSSYFTIWDVDGGARPFTIEAGAPANSLYVQNYGNIGIGTSVPALEIHVADSDTPALRLEQDGSGGWAPQTWDVAGNETFFFVRDVTYGSKLPFSIEPNTPSNALCLRNEGRVGIGTLWPATPLELETTGIAAEFMLDQTDGASCVLSATGENVTMGSKSDHPLSFVANDAEVASLDTGGNLILTGNLELGSSRDIKQNIKPVDIEEALCALNEMQPVKFSYKSRPAEENVGFVAEDVPELLATESRKTTSPMDFVAVLTRVIQEQQKTINELSIKMAELEHHVKANP
jgi:hypothetical protein